MSRYIDADATLNTIKKYLYETALNNVITDRKFAEDCEEIAKNRLAIWVDDVPTADVREVVYGEWKLNNLFGFKIYDCSNCGIHMETRWNYCPHCGAKMERGEDENRSNI